MNIIFIILDMISTTAFSISGAIVAINKKMDILGVVVLGLTTAVGGGVIRDLILGINPPLSFQNPRNALISIATSMIVFLPKIRKILTNKRNAHSLIMLIADSIGLSLFTVIGVYSVFNTGFNNNYFLAIFLGVITGTGGGIMRDTMAGNRPYIFIKDFYASASLIGAIMCTLLYKPIGSIAAMILSAAVIFGLRICASRYKWHLPKS